MRGTWTQSPEERTLERDQLPQSSEDQTVTMEKVEDEDNFVSDPSLVELLEVEIKDLETALESEKSSKEILRQELDNSSAEIERLTQENNSQLNESKSELAACKAILDHVKDELATAKAALKEKDDVLIEVEHDLLLNKQEIRELQEHAQITLQDRRNHIHELSSQLETLENENRRMERSLVEMTSLSNQPSASEVEIEHLRDQLKSLQRSQSSMQGEVNALNLQLRDKEQEIDHLSGRIQDFTIASSLTDCLSDQVTELHADISGLRLENQELKRETTKLAHEKLVIAKSVSELEQEKRALSLRISDLEKVRPADGVVICIDLSSSLNHRKVNMAKEAFRIITKGIRGRNSKTNVGVIVQNTSIWTAGAISPIDSATDRILDVVLGGGAESYHSAIPRIEEMLSTFWSKYPKRASRVILIGDGQAAGGYPEATLHSIQARGTPIHNVVVSLDLISGTEASSSATSKMSTRTDGRNFVYSGSSNTLLSDFLLGRPP